MEKDESILIAVLETDLRKWISQLNAETVDKEVIAKEMQDYVDLVIVH